jgi:tRNA (cytidine/uridine-2'-O-)-methyltransferase
MYDPVLHIVLHEPEIPDNAGNIGRTCVALGAKLWMVRPLGCRIEDRRIRRSGMDYWQHLVWEAVDDWTMLLARLPRTERKPWLFSKSAARLYHTARFQRGDVLVFGSESRGLPRALLDVDPQQSLRIPIRADARSLNLAVAVAVAAYEAQRQWESA